MSCTALELNAVSEHLIATTHLCNACDPLFDGLGTVQPKEVEPLRFRVYFKSAHEPAGRGRAGEPVKGKEMLPFRKGLHRNLERTIG